MRRHKNAPPELPAPREAVEEFERVRPDADRRITLVHGPQTPADRAAARRRLDRLADQW